MNYNAQLIARVTATNRANAAANRLHALMLAAAVPFNGKKVVAKTPYKHLTKAFAAALPENGPGVDRHANISDYSLGFTVKTRESIQGAESSVYAEASFYIGKLNAEGVLTLDADREPLARRSDYTAEEVRALREVASKAAEVARNAEAACSPFGLY